MNYAGIMPHAHNYMPIMPELRHTDIMGSSLLVINIWFFFSYAMLCNLVDMITSRPVLLGRCGSVIVHATLHFLIMILCIFEHAVKTSTSLELMQDESSFLES